MISNYLKVATRALRRYPVYAAVSASSIAIGFASCIVIYLYIQDERSYDRFHPDAANTYRLVRMWEESGFRPNTPAPVGPTIASENPDVETVTRVFKYWEDPLLANGRKAAIEQNVFFVDSTFFDVFGFTLERGDPDVALSRPNSIVITQALAQKYFGDQDPIGKPLSCNVDVALIVSGVMRAPPGNAHFHPDALISMDALPKVAFPSILSRWGLNAFKTYVKLSPQADTKAVAAYIEGFFRRTRGDSTSIMYMQPLLDIHLHSALLNEFEDNEDIRFLYLLGALSVLILLIASINYTNLATAHASARGGEVGMRKAVGADRRQLVRQFLGESLLLTSAAAVASLLPAAVGLELINDLTGKQLSLASLDAWSINGFACVVVVTALAAGAYPALVLSRSKPVLVLKGHATSEMSAGSFRKGLVLVQFVASICLVAVTMVVANQVDFLKTADLGFDREQVLVLPVQDDAMRKQYRPFRDQISRLSSVVSVAASNQYPGAGHASSTATWEGAGEDDEISISGNWVYDGFAETLGIRLAAGRFLERERESDLTGAVVINESAVRAIGWSTPHEALGKWISTGLDARKAMKIVGVVKDYNFESMHHPINPLVFYLGESEARNVLVRITAGNFRKTLSEMERTWDSFSENQPFVYSFLDAEFDRLYLKEYRWGRMVGYATAVAILIACLGLFGLTSFNTARRAKEIGIRKALGSSVASILVLMSRDIVALIGIAFVLAVPLAWYATHTWLENFAYRAETGPGSFIAAGVLTLVIALLTVSHLVLRAASSDPVKTLRYE